MAKCRRCGKRTWGRELCSDCALLLELEGKASGARRSDSVTREVRRTFIHRSSSTNINIVVNGKPVSVSAEEGATPELLQRLSTELDLPEEQLQSLLGRAFQQLGETSLGDEVHAGEGEASLHGEGLGEDETGADVHLAAPLGARGPLHKVTCPGCQRTVPDRNGWCMYCGAELVQEPAAAATNVPEQAADVDRAFLEEDVRPSEPAQEERDKLRETYRNRLSDL